jgi:hypothetical protein
VTVRGGCTRSRAGVTRQPGLRDLDRLDVLDKVYQNRDVVIYKIRTGPDA